MNVIVIIIIIIFISVYGLYFLNV